MIPERRHVPRYQLGLEIRADDVWGMTSNISLEGLKFVSARSFTPGQTISITLFVPADRSSGVMRLEGSGIVRRVERNIGGDYETAVELDGLRVLTDVQAADGRDRRVTSARQ